MSRLIRCPRCLGSGDAGEPLVSVGWCPDCDGSGRIPDRRRGPDRQLVSVVAWIALAVVILVLVAWVRRG